MPMIVTIDGPAGAGKSSCARRLAERLGFNFLDTGAMYRAVALAVIRAGANVRSGNDVATILDQIDLQVDGQRVALNGVDVTNEIRTAEVTAATRFVADHPAVREQLVQAQRRIAHGKNFVTEGRDQGTVAFPDAECKIFLTATPEERARRRSLELQAAGQEVDWREVLAEQTNRDLRDEQRPVGKLMKASDAVELLTDGLSQDEVVNRLEEIVRRAMG